MSKELELNVESKQQSSTLILDVEDTGRGHVPSTRRVWKRPRLRSHSVLRQENEERFIMASYNILASEHAQKHRHLYSSLHSYYLQWGRRRGKIIQGLDACSPDIICLQEVDKFEDLEEAMASRGFIGLYKRRTGEATDGCAIFWKKNRFQLLQERSFEFSMLDMRNNVAQLCALQLIRKSQASNHIRTRSDDQIEGHCLVVGNIHVLYNPKRGDIKLGQCRAFLEQVHNMSYIWNGAPVVIGGDFNSTPSSAIYKYLATSQLELANLDRNLVSGLVLENLDPIDCSQIKYSPHTNAVMRDAEVSVQDKYGWNKEELRLATGKDACTLVEHGLKLSSTYSDIQGSSATRDAQGEPLLTTCHRKFSGTVDYIWRNDGLRTLGVLEPLPLKMFAESKGLPVKVFGSDHLLLACELTFSEKGY